MTALFHIGPQKTATTWVYRCLNEHPDVSVPSSDSIHYYDIFYNKGQHWYLKHFSPPDSTTRFFDPTYTYIRSPLAAKRIHQESPEAKIALTLRNPIERAFSHYWHEKKKRTITFEFSECLNNYDLFSTWIETGFYAEHIERYLEYFSKEQLLCLRFEDIADRPQILLDQLCTFYGVKKFTPSCIHKISNGTRPLQTFSGRLETKLQHAGDKQIPVLSSFTLPFYKIVKNYNQTNNFERLSDIHKNVIKELQEIYLPEIDRLEILLGIDLSDWKKYD